MMAHSIKLCRSSSQTTTARARSGFEHGSTSWRGSRGSAMPTPCTTFSSGRFGATLRDERETAASRCKPELPVMTRRLVGSMLVRNESVFVEQAIRNVAAVCDRIHVVDHVSDDGTWDVLVR